MGWQMVAMLLGVAGGAVLLGAGVILTKKYQRINREHQIRYGVLPKGLFDRLRKHHPQLSDKDCQLVAQGLRQFFMAHLKSGRQFVAMPSQVVDDLWHEFILYTKNYDEYCKRAFGQFLHHTPAVVMSTAQSQNTALRRCWYFCCKEENINPAKATRLPLLFALDAKLGISNGFHYVPNCDSVRRSDDGSLDAYCAAEIAVNCGGGVSFSDFESESRSHSSDAFFSSDSSSDSGGSDSGGSSCGGGGCGGGGD